MRRLHSAPPVPTSPLERGARAGESPVDRLGKEGSSRERRVQESDCLGMQSKAGGKFHLKLNTGERPIANKYREGKMKSTLKRELKST